MLCGGIWYITYMCLFLCSTVCNYFIKISPNFHDCSIFLNATVASKLQVVTPLQTGLRLLRSSRSFAQHANEPSAKVKKKRTSKKRLFCTFASPSLWSPLPVSGAPGLQFLSDWDGRPQAAATALHMPVVLAVRVLSHSLSHYAQGYAVDSYGSVQSRHRVAHTHE